MEHILQLLVMKS